ncbi:uncharacterized protein LOC129591674 [Paramacrobiotus metropolitanus]|uniref:uncharacterized protein LOC129591674 n=1 Tax=Paramacrobiotus metropolitanus TaxID=2943436 RepID=UPI00244576B7|nr:uncharacterized protein LOC129591674 [Paramacrobiotus metropolitanus]
MSQIRISSITASQTRSTKSEAWMNSIRQSSEALQEFNQLNPRTVSSDVILQKLELIKDILLQMDHARKELSADEVRNMVSEHYSDVFALLLGIYRNYPPGMKSMFFTREGLKFFMDACKDHVSNLTKPAYNDHQFASHCLRHKVADDSAFPVAIILCTIMGHIPKRIGHMNHWLTAGSDGDLLLMNQMFSCLVHLHPEICLPATIKQQDFYTYVLTGVCSIIPVLNSQQIAECQKSLLRHLQSDRFLVALFASDVIKFVCRYVCRISSFEIAFRITVAVFRGFVDGFRGGFGKMHNAVIRNLCARTFAELPASMKVELLEMFPVRRHFFIWSYLPLASYSELHSSSVFQELFNESMTTIDGVFDKNTSATSMQMLVVRLPLSLRCLTNLLPLFDATKPGEWEFSPAGIAKQFMRLFRFLTVEQLSLLPLIQTSCCALLKLGSALYRYLLDTEIVEIMKYLVENEKDPDVLIAGVDFVKSIVPQRKIGIGLSEYIRNFFSMLCSHQNALVKSCAVSAFCWIGMHIRCERLLSYLSGGVRGNENVFTYLSLGRVEDKTLARMYATLQRPVDSEHPVGATRSLEDCVDHAVDKSRKRKKSECESVASGEFEPDAKDADLDDLI